MNGTWRWDRKCTAGLEYALNSWGNNSKGKKSLVIEASGLSICVSSSSSTSSSFSHDKIWLLNADGCSEWPLSFLHRSLQRYHFEWSVMATLLLIQSITSSYLGRRTHTLVVPQFVNQLGRPMNGRGLFNLPNWLCPATRTICGAHIIVNMLMGSNHPTSVVSCLVGKNQENMQISQQHLQFVVLVLLMFPSNCEGKVDLL